MATLKKARFMSALPRTTEYFLAWDHACKGESVTLRVLSEDGRERWRDAANRTKTITKTETVNGVAIEVEEVIADPDPLERFIYLRETVTFADDEELTLDDIENIGGLESPAYLEINSASRAWNGFLRGEPTADPKTILLKEAVAPEKGGATFPEGEGEAEAA